MFRLLRLLILGPEDLRTRVEKIESEWRVARAEFNDLFDKTYRQAQRLARREESRPTVQEGNGGLIGGGVALGLPPRVRARRGL
ncbi:MAG: hypothetical protein ACREKH_04330 [Candidatus Rokuibacteriota bacterium]